MMPCFYSIDVGFMTRICSHYKNLSCELKNFKVLYENILSYFMLVFYLIIDAAAAAVLSNCDSFGCFHVYDPVCGSDGKTYCKYCK